MAFLEFILTFFLILILLGYISRFLLKLYFRRLAKRMGVYEEQQEQKVGETYIQDTVNREKIVTKDVGDYIDYEEINEK